MSVPISASVGEGGYNRDPDVRRVQSLLNRVPQAKGGPVPPLKVDGLCYGKTLAAIASFQRKGCGFVSPDKRIDPGGRTWTELVKYEASTSTGNTIVCFPSAGAAGTTSAYRSSSSLAATGAVTADTLVAEARAAIPIAVAWVIAARAKLAVVRSKIQRYHVYTADEIKSFESIETHFKVAIPTTTDTESRARIDKINGNYGLIQQALGVLTTGRLVGNPGLAAKAQASVGGYTYSSTNVEIGADFHNCNLNMRAAVLIHECGHWVDAQCSHVASELPAFNGSAMTDAAGQAANPSHKNYKQMDYALAIRNAYSFAQCALHNGVGADKRPP